MKKFTTPKTKQPKTVHHCNDGPWGGQYIALDSTGDGKTGVMEFSGLRGRYVAKGRDGANWESVE